MKLTLTALTLAIAVAACSPKASDQVAADNSADVSNNAVTNNSTLPDLDSVANEPVANGPAEATSNGDENASAAAPPKTSLPEPKGPIDPKSIEAAGQVVQHYGALIEQKRWTASRQYWGDASTAQAFEKNFLTWKDVHLEIGDLGPAEGAAGSIYTNMPVRFYGNLNKGGNGSFKANIVLRRINDVDGSTAAQRRWHIEQIEKK